MHLDEIARTREGAVERAERPAEDRLRLGDQIASGMNVRGACDAGKRGAEEQR
jgi:hypothetical protein